MSKKPIDVDCPRCFARPGSKCQSAIRRSRTITRGHHPERKQFAEGTYKPTVEYVLRKEIRLVEERLAITNPAIWLKADGSPIVERVTIEDIESGRVVPIDPAVGARLLQFIKDNRHVYWPPESEHEKSEF